jgi:WD40 repeat protein
MSSREAPRASFSLKYGVLAFSSASDSFFMAGSRALTWARMGWIFLMARSLAEPKSLTDASERAVAKQSEPAREPASAAERRGNPPDSLPFSAADAALPLTEISAAAFHPGGALVFTAGDPHSILWDAATGAERQRLATRGRVVDARFLPDGRLLLALPGRVETWGEAEGTWKKQQAAKTRGSGILSPDGRFLLSDVRAGDSESSTTRVVDIATGRPVKNPRLAGLAVQGPHLISTWLGGKLALFADPQAEPRLFPAAVGPEAVAVSADGTRAVVRSADDGAWLWDLTTGRPLQVKPGRFGQALAVGFVPEGPRAVFLNENSDVELWDVAIPKPLRTLEKGWDGTLYTFDGGDLFIGTNPPKALDLKTGKRRVLSQEEMGRLFSQEVTDGVTSDAAACGSGRPAGDGLVAVYDGRIRRCGVDGKVQWEAWPGPAGQWVTRFADGKLLRADEGAVEVQGADGAWVAVPLP